MIEIGAHGGRRRRVRVGGWLVVWAAVGVMACGRGVSERRAGEERPAGGRPLSTYGRLIDRLSEPGGFFDTDNLISNETSYLHVIGALRAMGVRGGAYLGVGPDQNFSYIAEIRPSVAIIVDIRRDNMLQQLLFKALFAEADTRVGYLARLFGRPVPGDAAAWADATPSDLADYIDGHPYDPALADEFASQVRARVESFGVDLSAADLETIDRFHRTFMRAGLSLRFNSFGRAPQPYYPTYRQLMLERDLAGEQANYLADEEDFRFLKTLQGRDRLVPVVGDLAGDEAMPAIAAYLEEIGERVSAFYTSNVEFYVMDAGTFRQFADNVIALPRAEPGVIIRSYFGGRFRFRHPLAVPGHYSVQLLQPLDRFDAVYRAEGFPSYLDLVTRDAVPLR